jgi:hypothetical protein
LNYRTNKTVYQTPINESDLTAGSPQSFVKKLKNPAPLNVVNEINKFNMDDLYPNVRFSLIIFLAGDDTKLNEERSSSLATFQLTKLSLKAPISPNR